MALSRTAELMAMEIRNHDWSDAPYRVDRAGHRREFPGGSVVKETLSATEAEAVRLNVTFVTAQVLASEDPNFPLSEYAEACGNSSLDEGGVFYGVRHTSGGKVESPETFLGQPRKFPGAREQ